MAESGEEIGGGGVALEGLGAAAENGAFGDDELSGTDIAMELGLVADLDGIGGGDVAVHLAVQDDLGGLDIALQNRLRPDQQGAGGDDLAFKGAVELQVAIEGEGALELHLIGDDGAAARAPAFRLKG